MGESDKLSAIRTRFAACAITERPFFISPANWEILLDYAVRGRGLTEIAASQQRSVEQVRQVLRATDRQLSLPRSGREWTRVTSNSPIEDLSLSVRALNQLHDLGCATVEDVMRLDLARRAMGRTSRQELIEALRRCGFTLASDLPTPNSDLDRMSAQLRELRDRISKDVRSWQHQVTWIESRLRKLSKSEG